MFCKQLRLINTTSAFALKFNMPALVLQTEYISPQAFYGATNNKEGNGPLTHYLYPPPARQTLTANSTGIQAVNSLFGFTSAAEWGYGGASIYFSCLVSRSVNIALCTTSGA